MSLFSNPPESSPETPTTGQNRDAAEHGLFLRLVTPLSAWLGDPSNRLLKWTAATSVLSLTWHLLVLVRLADCPAYAVRTLSNEITFSVIHPTSFALAVGLFVLAFDWRVAFEDGPVMKLPSLVLLIILLVIGFAIPIADFLGGRCSPYEVRDSCTVFQAEDAVRRSFKELQPDDDPKSPRHEKYEADKKAYLKLLTRDRMVWTSYGNLLFSVGFTVFFNIVFWFGLVVLLNIHCGTRMSDMQQRQDMASKLVVIFLLHALWFPCRVYASWYQNDFLGNDWLRDYWAFWVVVGYNVVFVTALILIYGLRQSRRLLPFLSFGGVCSLAYGLKYLYDVRQTWLPIVEAVLNWLHPFPAAVIVLALVLLAFEILLIRYLLHSHLVGLWKTLLHAFTKGK